MKTFCISTVNSGWLRRTLTALALALALLALLLGLGGRLSAAEAPRPAVIGPGNPGRILHNTDAPAAYQTTMLRTPISGTLPITYFVFLPQVMHMEPEIPDLVFYDDFSNSSSGWPRDSTDDCSFDYNDGRYRVKMKKDNQRCIIAGFPVPRQLNGTFTIKIRRTSDADRDVLYGFFFGAGSAASKDRWALEVRPNKKCNSKGFFWLSAREDNKDEFFDDKCTDAIKTGDDEWNELKVIRYVDPNDKDKDFIKIYINGIYKGNYNGKDHNIDHLRDGSKFGYFDLEVISLDGDTSSSNPLIVEFDDFKVQRSILEP